MKNKQSKSLNKKGSGGIVNKVYRIKSTGSDEMWDASAEFLIDERDVVGMDIESCHPRKLILDVFRETEIPSDYVRRLVQNTDVVTDWCRLIHDKEPSVSKVLYWECGS